MLTSAPPTPTPVSPTPTLLPPTPVTTYALDYQTSLQVQGGGGGGGQPGSSRCLSGYVVTGLVGRSGDRIDQVNFQCSKLNSDGTTGTSYLASPAYGGGGGNPYTLTCPPNLMLTEVKGRSGTGVDRLQALCLNIDRTRNFQSVEVGGTGGNPFDSQCPPDYIMTGLDVRSGDRLDHINFICNGIVKK
jgi:jacalin-like lectin domain-containing protein